MSVVSAHNFCYVVFDNDKIELLIEKRDGDVFWTCTYRCQMSVVLACNCCYVVFLDDISSIYTGVGSFSLQFLLCCVS